MTRALLGSRAARRLTVVGFAAVIILAVTAGTAAAHAVLVSSSPNQSAHYAAGSPPSTITVTFNDKVTTTARSIGVFDGAGHAMNVTPVHAANAKVVEARLAKIPDGSYAVVWHIVSDDGHPETGAFTFSVGAASAQAVDIRSLEARQKASRGVGFAFGAVRFLDFFACLALVGALLFGRWRWASVMSRRTVRRILLVIAAVGVLASLASISLQAAYSSGSGTSALLRGSALRAVVDARFGTSALVRAGLVAVLAGYALMPFLKRRPVRILVEAPLAFVALGVGATFAYAGHGFTGRWKAFGFVLDVAHLTAAAVWLGGVVLLAVALRRVDPRESARALSRFSRLALPAIGVVVLSGVLQGWRQIGTWSALWHTSYARLLIIKVLVVLAIVVLASASRANLRDPWRTDDEPDGEPDEEPGLPSSTALPMPASRGGDGASVAVDERTSAAIGLLEIAELPDDRLVREVRTGILLEAGLAALVLAVTSILVVSPPSREAVAAAKIPQPQTVRLTASGKSIGYTVAVQPSLAGENTLVVNPRLTKGTGLLPTTLTGTVRSAGSSASSRLTFTPLTDGQWVAVAPFTTAGTWTVQLDGATPSSSEVTTFEIQVR